MPFVLLLQLGIILFLAKFLGRIVNKMGVSPVVGEILAGVVAGPVLKIVEPSVSLEIFSTIGVMLLVFLIGLETNFKEVKSAVYTGSAISITGCILAFLGGFGLGLMLFNSTSIGIVMGVIMISTSTVIPIRIFMERNEYKTKVGQTFAVSSLADDVTAILALSLLIGYFSNTIGGITQIALLFFTVLGFIYLLTTFGNKILSSMIRKLHLAKDDQTFLAITLAAIMIVTFLSDRAGIAGITGAFLAGIAMSNTTMKNEIIMPKIRTLGYGFVVPIFFAYSALFLDLPVLWTSAGVILIVLLVGAATKAIGPGILAGFMGFTRKNQRMIAIGMIPRGEYGIFIAQIALGMTIITQQVYTIMIAFIILTIVITPLLFALDKKI
ncbi:MAG TPA: cation:proton antiporter [archaeon]|nr:cation:proton antiporter [archaeon]